MSSFLAGSARWAAPLLLALSFSPSLLRAQEAQPHSGHVLLTPGEVKWGPGPASLPRGAQAVVVEGDPSREGPFTLRLQMPDGYRIAPHWHPGVEHITVLWGTFVMQPGDEPRAAKTLTPGSFAVMPPRMVHQAHTVGETIVQLHGMGPWGITYVNPADDPRNR